MNCNKANIRIEMNSSNIKEVLTALNELENPKVMIKFYHEKINHIIEIFPSFLHSLSKDKTYNTFIKNQRMIVLKEKDAYLKLEKELISKYCGKFVAIADGKVIGIGKNKIELASQIYKNRGYVPMYIGQVGAKDRIVRIPSPKVKKS